MEFHNKRRIKGALCVLGTSVILTAIFYACNDFGLEADFLKGSIKGVLRLNAAIPDTTGEIRVALVKKFPPTNFAELLLSNNLYNKDDTTKIDSLSFEFEVPLEEFDAIAAVWKGRGKPWDILRNVIGVYCNQKIELINIVLTNSERTAEGIEFVANMQKVDRTSSVTGQIELKGEWPNNIANFGLAVIKSFSLNICNFPDLEIKLLPKEPVEQLNYEIDIAPGNYLILIVWQSEGADLLDFQVIGLSQELSIADSVHVSDINIIADFDNPLPF